MKGGSVFSLSVTAIVCGLTGVYNFAPWGADAVYGVRPTLGVFLLCVSTILFSVLIQEME